MKTEFVLIDFENVQPGIVGKSSGNRRKIRIFLGSNQSKIPVETARALQLYGTDAEYVRIDGSGKNALDFHIAYYLGRLAAENPGASFHVISKDTGFDPLIKHLRAQKISCYRSKSLADLSLAGTPESGPVADMVQAVIDHLVGLKAAKPRTVRTLRSNIRARFPDQIGDEGLDRLIEKLVERGAISVVEGRVHYALQS